MTAILLDALISEDLAIRARDIGWSGVLPDRRPFLEDVYLWLEAAHLHPACLLAVQKPQDNGCKHNNRNCDNKHVTIAAGEGIRICLTHRLFFLSRQFVVSLRVPPAGSGIQARHA